MAYILKAEQLEIGIHIKFKHPVCSEVSGPLTYKISLKCTNDWCSPNAKLWSKENLFKLIRLEEDILIKSNDFSVLPYSDYNLVLQTGRTNGDFHDSSSKVSFKSLPTGKVNI